VLLDLDGTLTDTTYLHTVIWWQALRSYGHVVPMARIHRAVGLGADHLLDEVLGTERERDRSADDGIADALFAAEYERLVPLPGARDLLGACRDLGLRTVLASSASQRDLEADLDAFDAHDLVDEATTSADAEDSKPSPDILSAALEQAELAAEDVVYIGDAVWDVKAAGRLGISCVGLESGGTSRAELLEAGAYETWVDTAARVRQLDSSLIGHLSRGERLD